MLAHLVVAKCVDSIPFYRLEKDFKRQGVAVPSLEPLSRSLAKVEIGNTTEALMANHAAAPSRGVVVRRQDELVAQRQVIAFCVIKRHEPNGCITWR